MVAAALTGCGGQTQTTSSQQTQPQTTAVETVANAGSATKGTIQIDGSSTVYPITDAVAKKYREKRGEQTQINVQFSGTGGGFKKFCAGETDISNASRPILAKEMEACNQGGVRYIELPIAFDALTIVVNPQNTWAKDITIDELKKIWEPAAQGKVTNWKQVRAGYPDRSLKLFGPGTDSGTYDYFTEVVTGSDGGSRTDFTGSEDDEVIAQGVEKDANALGYFGYAYYEQHKVRLRALPVNSGKGIVEPSRETVEKAQYQPFSRPLFIYVNAKAAQEKPEIREFVTFYLENASSLVNSVGYVPLPDEGYRLSFVHFQRGKVGTVFEGTPQPNLTIAELLRKQAVF